MSPGRETLSQGSVDVREAVRQHIVQPEERSRLYRFCRRLTGDAEVAEDLTQDALIEAWRLADTVQNPTVWRSWLHGIARNMYLRWNRSHGREMSRRLSPTDTTVTALLESRADDSTDLSA